MSEYENNEIIYEEGWRDQAPPAEDALPPDETPPAEAAAEQPRAAASKPLLITIRLVLCLIAALVLFLLKTMDSPAYHSFMTWYRAEMNRPVISQSFFESLGVKPLSSPDEVRVKASPDALPPG